MKLSECKRCSLSKHRLHPSLNKGKKSANVLIVFGKEPYTSIGKEKQKMFVKKLHLLLKWDWHYTYAIKCCCKKPVNLEQIKACRPWINNTVKSVDPYLIILMGSVAVKSILGAKYAKLPVGIFYMKKTKSGKKRQYYIGSRITGDSEDLETHLNRLILYIQENYG